MICTKYSLAEQVIRLLNGGEIPVASKVKINEAKIAIEQCLNKLLKMEYFTLNTKMGELIPNGASVATYTGIPVVQYGNVSKSILPAFPLKLPRGIGVYQIFDPANPDSYFIPLEMGQKGLISSQPMINTLLGQVGYEWYGMDVVYTSDISATINAVTIRLVVLDMGQYTDWQELPIPADMAQQCIDETYKFFATEPVADKLDDPGVNEQRNIPIQQQSQP